MKNFIVFIIVGVMLLSVCGWVSKPQEDFSVRVVAREQNDRTAYADTFNDSIPTNVFAD